jgi:hypothetical protein
MYKEKIKNNTIVVKRCKREGKRGGNKRKFMCGFNSLEMD